MTGGGPDTRWAGADGHLPPPPYGAGHSRIALRQGPRMAFRLKLPGGTFKIKVYRELREAERARKVLVLKIGRFYFVWWPD